MLNRRVVTKSLASFAAISFALVLAVTPADAQQHGTSQQPHHPESQAGSSTTPPPAPGPGMKGGAMPMMDMCRQMMTDMAGMPMMHGSTPADPKERVDLDVVLLQVNRPIPPVVMEGSRYIDVEDLEGRREKAEAYLAGLAAEMTAKGVRAETRVRRGEPVHEILAAARDEDADLIAMTTHGRSGPARILFGSIAEGVLRHAGIPVFLMRQTEREIARRRSETATR